MPSAASPRTGAPEEVIITAAGAAGHHARPQVSERITVPLIRGSTRDLRRLQERTNLSRTDIVNRAITAYEFLDAKLKSGHDLIVRNRRTGETQLVRFL
jgi:hypothetical protein